MYAEARDAIPFRARCVTGADSKAFVTAVIIEVDDGIVSDGLLEHVLAVVPHDARAVFAEERGPARRLAQNVARAQFEARCEVGHRALAEEAVCVRQRGRVVFGERAVVDGLETAHKHLRVLRQRGYQRGGAGVAHEEQHERARTCSSACARWDARARRRVRRRVRRCGLRVTPQPRGAHGFCGLELLVRHGASGCAHVEQHGDHAKEERHEQKPHNGGAARLRSHYESARNRSVRCSGVAQTQ
eukprot:IDg19336t1